MNGVNGESSVVPVEKSGSGRKLEVGLEIEDTDIASKGEKWGFGDKLNERPSWFDDISNSGKSGKQDA